MTSPLCYSPETITILLISYSPIQNKKFKKKKKKKKALCLKTGGFLLISREIRNAQLLLMMIESTPISVPQG